MATIRKIMSVGAEPAAVWDVFRDIGALHTRLVPGFVTNTVVEDRARHVTFGNGMTITERIVSIDDDLRRLVYSATGGRATHHNASVQVFDDGAGGSRVEWVVDLLPDEVGPAIDGMMDQAVKVMERTLGNLAG